MFFSNPSSIATDIKAERQLRLVDAGVDGLPPRDVPIDIKAERQLRLVLDAVLESVRLRV